MVDRVTIQPGYLPLLEAALWAGVSVRTLRRLVKKGLPTYQAGPMEADSPLPWLMHRRPYGPRKKSRYSRGCRRIDDGTVGGGGVGSVEVGTQRETWEPLKERNRRMGNGDSCVRRGGRRWSWREESNLQPAVYKTQAKRI